MSTSVHRRPGADAQVDLEVMPRPGPPRGEAVGVGAVTALGIAPALRLPRACRPATREPDRSQACPDVDAASSADEAVVVPAAVVVGVLANVVVVVGAAVVVVVPEELDT